MEAVERMILGVERDSRYSMFAQILKLCRQAQTKADLYYVKPKRFNYPLLGQLLGQCVKFKLLQQKDDGKYETTRKGERFIKQFEDILHFIKSESD